MTIEQVTESQRLLAQAIGGLATAAGNAVTMEISTVAVLKTTSVPVSVQAIQVYGTSTAGDGGDGIYVRGTGTGSITSADGASWVPVVKTAAQFTTTPVKFAALPAAASSLGMVRAVSDSNTIVWGATIAGGGTNKVLAWSNGAHWTVIGI